ncbi:MAG: MFS transporter [SAR202 cluster bacterium]|nr:MFS transporter [SAR202 cluster bacterium]|tara:strand:+ start:14431 stop:15840 length:1410 start_codon:yes stop_codon:yes gene_type:complete
MTYEPPRDPEIQNPKGTASDNNQQSHADNLIPSEQVSQTAPKPPPPAAGGTNRTLSLRDLRTFSSLKNPVFRLYYIAMLGQMGAMNMQMIVRSLLIYRITESGTALGIMALANAAPMLFFSLFGGVIADRVQKKYVLFWGQLVSALISLAMALSLVFGFLGVDKPDSWWILIAGSLVQGITMGLMMPSRQAMIAEIVGEEQLMNAVALNTFGMNFNRLMMPAVGGFMIEFFGFASTYFLMTALYIVAVFFIYLMPKTGTISLKGAGALADVVEGLQYVKNNRTILIILIVTFLTVLFSMPYMMLLPVFSEDVLDVGAGGLGVLVSVSGVGAMIGSIILASLPNKKRGLILMAGSAVLGVGLVGFSFSSWWIPSLAWPLALGFILIVGLGQTTRMTLGNTLLQYYVEDQYRGRVMSLYMMEFGLTSFAVFLTGVLTDTIGVEWSVGGLAIILVIMSLFVIAFVPRIRNLD